MNEKHLRRVRRLCLALPDTSEKLSHGEPTFFVHKKVFAMFSNNHHHGGHIAVVLPAPPGAQAELISTSPEIFYKPPYVGGRGWIGIELGRISDDDLSFHVHMAWELIAPRRVASRPPPPASPRSTRRNRKTPGHRGPAPG